jgi:hypothetical protein
MAADSLAGPLDFSPVVRLAAGLGTKARESASLGILDVESGELLHAEQLRVSQ